MEVKNHEYQINNFYGQNQTFFADKKHRFRSTNRNQISRPNMQNAVIMNKTRRIKAKNENLRLKDIIKPSKLMIQTLILPGSPTYSVENTSYDDTQTYNSKEKLHEGIIMIPEEDR